MSEVKKCSCGECATCAVSCGIHSWYVKQAPEISYPEYCWNCGEKLNSDGTTGPMYAELEAELAEAKRRAAWYLMLLTQKVEDGCAICKYDNVPANAEPCASCSESYGDKYNFKLAPVPDDFEKATE